MLQINKNLLELANIKYRTRRRILVQQRFNIKKKNYQSSFYVNQNAI